MKRKIITKVLKEQDWIHEDTIEFIIDEAAKAIKEGLEKIGDNTLEDVGYIEFGKSSWQEFWKEFGV